MPRHGLNQVPLKPFTDMNSYQLQTSTNLPSQIGLNIVHFVSIVEDVHETDEAKTVKRLTESIQKIVHRFDSVISLLIVYVIPLLP
jgi:hypothetical protein